MTGISLRNVVKRFGEMVVVPELSLEIAEGEFVVIVGPSGCGKSTTLRMIAGLEEVSSGSIHIAGRDVTWVPPKERDIAMVFQSYALYPHMNVAENMSFALRLSRTPREEIRERVERAAAMLELTAYLDRKPKDLSGGQRQRVAMGRSYGMPIVSCSTSPFPTWMPSSGHQCAPNCRCCTRSLTAR